MAQFINDLENVLLETDAGGSTQVAYTPEPQTYGNLISQRRSGGTSWHHFDGLGSTERLTAANQAALATYLNTVFGVPVLATGAHPNRLRYKGRIGYRFEPDLLEYDIRRRRKRPARGRWLSPDPERNGRTWYTYAANAPTSLDDPSGMSLPIDPSWPAEKFYNEIGKIIVKAARKIAYCTFVRTADAQGKDSEPLIIMELPEAYAKQYPVITVLEHWMCTWSSKPGHVDWPRGCGSCWYTAWHYEYAKRRIGGSWWRPKYELVVVGPIFDLVPYQCEADASVRSPVDRCRR